MTEPQQPLAAPTQDDRIKHMVDRFLGWKLPKDFNPDGGIKFEPYPNIQPIGTNLLTATQAEEMIRYITSEAAPTNNQNSLDEIFDILDDDLNNQPGTATEIGWEAWAEEKQEYYAKAKAAINKTIMEDLLAIVGPDIPIYVDGKQMKNGDAIQLDFSGGVESAKFRQSCINIQDNGKNIEKARIRQQITKKYGGKS